MKQDIHLNGTSVSACYAIPGSVKQIKHQPNTTKIMETISTEERARFLKADHIIAIVADFMELSTKELKSSSRRQYLVDGRSICMYFLREFKNMSFQQIGDIFKRDHATAIHCYRRCLDLMETDKDFRTSVESVRKILLK